jgi:hypothetical protein
MSHRDGPPPIFERDNFSYWKICMEAYLEAIDVRAYGAATQGFLKPKDPALLVMRQTTRSEMQRLETPSLEVFARMSLIVYGTTKMPMNYGQILCAP